MFIFWSVKNLALKDKSHHQSLFSEYLYPVKMFGVNWPHSFYKLDRFETINIFKLLRKQSSLQKYRVKSL